MLSNKEKRLSHAPADVFPLENNINSANYGLFNNNHQLNHHAIKDPNIKKLINEHRNSHSLNHDFSQLYISNLKNHIDSHTNVKRVDSNHPPPFEEMSSYKKEALEYKKQMLQLQKSINFWSDCTEYWRNKWRDTRSENNQLKSELKQLKSRINKLEHQVQISDEKRYRLGNEVNLLNEELSRYMYRAEDDVNNSQSKSKQIQQHLYYNSDRRVDYRKKHRRKKEFFKENSKINESSSDSDSRDNAHPHSYTIQKEENSLIKKINELPSSNFGNSKIVFRNHDRLFDKKIINKKRFSQVVMLDEEEIFQMNKEIPLTRNNSENSTLKANNNQHVQDFNETSYTDNKHRLMEYVPEDVEEEYSFDDRIKPGHFFNDDIDFDSTGVAGSSTNIKNTNSNVATVTTNSDCLNVSQNAIDQFDENKSTSINEQEHSVDNDMNRTFENHQILHETDDEV